MDRKDKGSKASFFGTFMKGKDRKSQKSVTSYGSAVNEETSNGGAGDAMQSAQEIVNRFSDSEVDTRFEQMLDDMNLNEVMKEPLRKKSQDQKRKMLAMQYKGSVQPKGASDTPQAFIQHLRNPDLKGDKRLKVLESLRVSLTSNPVSWVQDFGVDGLKAILKNLTYCCDNKVERRSTNECVRCLKAYMNNKFGLRQIIDHEEALTILARTVDPSDPNTMLEAVRLLAAICLVPPDGHEKILEGITVCGEIRTQNRFDPIIMGLGMRDNQQMQVACIQLINSLISTPEELDFRLHLRNEFMRTGLVDLLPSLDLQDNDELKTQLNVFHEHKEEDFEEFSHRYDNIRMDLEDPRECFDLLYQTVVNTVAEPYFVSILQHLLSIRDDLFARPQYYKLIEECVTQIVLHRSGVDPDFRLTQRFDIDVEPLLSSLSEKSKFEDAEHSVVEVNQKLEAALTAKQESEAKLLSLEEKVKLYEAEIAQLRGNIKDGIGSVISDSLAQRAAGGAGPPPPPPPPPLPGMGGPPPPPPPPPPPFPGMGGPPPPPPPPFPGMGGPPPPPPPPPAPGAPPPAPGAPAPPGGPPPPAFMGNQLPYGMKPKKKYTVAAQMKRANWDKLNAKVLDKDSFWVKVNEQEFESDDLFKELQERFSTQVKVKAESTEPTEKKTSKKAKDFRVLDAKVGQNLSILLGSVKVPYKEIKRRIVEMDEENLSAALLEQLIKLMPEPEQMKQLADMKDQYDELAEPEQFTIEMSSVKRVIPRLKSMLFKRNFPELVSDIKPDLVAATEACEEVKKSQKFAKLLQLILLVGNYMNAGSRNAQSLGFQINYLSKLSNTKTNDNKSTLTHFLAQAVEDKHPNLLAFPDELIHIDKAARVSDEVLQKNIKHMDKSIQQLELDLKNISKSSGPNDRFAEVMKEFVKDAQEQFDVLNSMYKKMEGLFKELSKFYCFDVKKYGIEELFGDLKTFKDSFVQAVKDNAKLRETEEKIKRAKEAKEKAEREKKDRMQRKKALVDMTIDDDQEGVMDNLLEALKTGQAFSVNREKREGKRRTPRAAGAERRAQLARSRSRQNLLESSTVREIDFNESGVDVPVPPPRRERGNNKSKTNNTPTTPTEAESEAEKLLERLKAL